MPHPDFTGPAEPIELPETSPVMILPHCNLLPHGLLPLFIFEPRYREMLADALAQDRLFCIGMLKPDAREDDPPAKAVFDHSTISLIRASVAHDDGTSHLILQGIRRVRFLDWIDDHSYSVARIESVKSITDNQPRSDALALKLLEITKALIENGFEISDQLRNFLFSIEDPEIIADVVAYNFIPDPYTRQALLEMADIGDRLHHVVDQLNRTLADRRSS